MAIRDAGAKCQWNGHAMRRLRTATALFAAAALLAAGVMTLAQRAVAQSVDAGGGSFLTPFPEAETYRVQVYGDSLAEGLLGGLIEGLTGEARVLVQKKHRKLTTMLRTDGEDEAAAIDTELGRELAHIAVVMINPGDRYPWRQPFPRGMRANSDAWKDEFDRRRDEWKAVHGAKLDKLMRTLKRRGAAAYFVGLPILRRQEPTDDAQIVNELVRERAYVNGMRFIDVLATFADEDGAYTQQGPDLAGKIRQLRENDGVHFTSAGYRKLAYFVEREIKRDIAQARTERSIPLAGTEAEQKRIRPVKTAAADAPTARPGVPTVPGTKAGPGPAARPVASALEAGGGDIRADNARITIKSTNAQGRDDSLTIDILRPSIPANVVQLVTRRESADRASQVGDPLVTEMPGGLMLVASVTPASEAGAPGDGRRTTATNTVYYRALVKGERIEPKPGRADDFPWPRPESQPLPRIEPAAAPKAAPKPAPPAAQPATPAKNPPPKKAPAK
ncbi:MAG: DUF459 domain-containing protein [Hyphomicrobiaceae bacterium]